LIADGKVFRVGEFIIGVAGTRRPAEVLQYRLEVVAPPVGASVEDLDRFMATTFADAMREAMKNAGALTKDEEKGECFDATAIVALRGRVYFVAGDYSVTPIADGIWATGSGAAYALGSLRSTSGKPPHERIQTALEIAAYYAEGVRPPFHTIPPDRY
jgi:ATP-dependent protease HslVU (ClpYQ) peptidase subunit